MDKQISDYAKAEMSSHVRDILHALAWQSEPNHEKQKMRDTAATKSKLLPIVL
jgi:hypothetical protein